MKYEEYRQLMRRLTWLYALVLFGLMIPGVGLALFMANRFAASSTWQRPNVFLAVLPTLIAPILVSIVVTELLDKRIGIQCACGQSLSFGKHVRSLLKNGGMCPKCRVQAIEPNKQPDHDPESTASSRRGSAATLP